MDVSLPRTITSTLGILALTALIVACSGPSKTATDAAAVVSKPISTGETLQVLQTLNDGEIKQARLALERSPNDQVRTVAQLILDDHQSSNEDIAELSEELGVSLDKSPLSRGLEGQANRIHDDLKSRSGPDFDCLYLQRQQELHEVALETVSKHLLPAAELRETRQLLGETAPKLERHREAARQGMANLACNAG